MSAQTPTTDEATQLAIRTYRGIELGLGQAVPVAAIAAKIEAQHPGHLVLVQAGKFLHGYDRSAYALATLKGYKLKLVGTTDAPHIRVGFPAGNFKRRLWSMVADFGIPWAVALGTQASGHTVYVSTQPTGNSQVLDGVTPEIVAEVIEDLRQRNEVNKLAARELLTHPDTACFQLKAKTQELDTQILQDVARMPRDWRATYGESLRACMARILRAVMAYGLEENKPALLRGLSADLDCLKHYIAQAPQLSRLTLAFEHRAGLAVELGRLVGGLIRSMARPFVGRSGPEPFRLIPIGCATQFDVGSPCRQRRLLTSAFFGAHDSLATGKNVVGFGDPDGAATKPLCSQQAAFSLFGASSFGRAEWESRKALPVLHRFANPFGPALPFGDGSSGLHSNWSTHHDEIPRRIRASLSASRRPRRLHSRAQRHWLGAFLHRRSSGSLCCHSQAHRRAQPSSRIGRCWSLFGDGLGQPSRHREGDRRRASDGLALHARAPGAEAMTSEVKVDRDTAAKINPLISTIGTEDTLDSISSVIYELGYLAVGDHDLETGSLFHLFGAIAGALEWECNNIESAKCRRGECVGSRHD